MYVVYIPFNIQILLKFILGYFYNIIFQESIPFLAYLNNNYMILKVFLYMNCAVTLSYIIVVKWIMLWI